MRRIVDVIERLLAALWFGAGIFLAIAAAAVFAAATSHGAAADVVGILLMQWHYIALGVPVVLLAIDLFRKEGATMGRLIILTLAIVAASGQIMADLEARAMRERASVPISSLDATHPDRRSFARLHGISVGLLALQLLASGTLIATSRK